MEVYAHYLECPECGFIDKALDIQLSSHDFIEPFIRSAVNLFGFNMRDKDEEGTYFCSSPAIPKPFFLKLFDIPKELENKPYTKNLKYTFFEQIPGFASRNKIDFYQALCQANLRNPWVTCISVGELDSLFINAIYHPGLIFTMRDFLVFLETAYSGTDMILTELEEFLFQE